MFGVTTYTGDHRTVRAACSADANQAELASLEAERQDYLDDARAKLGEASDLVAKYRKEKSEAEAALEAAKARFAAAKLGMERLVDAASSARQAAARVRAETNGIVRSTESERDASIPDRERREEARYRMAVADADAAMSAVLIDALVSALGEAAPDHPLLAPLEVGYADGRPRTGIDAVFDDASDDVLSAHGLPTYASTLATSADEG